MSWGNTTYHSCNDSISSAPLEICLLLFSLHSPSISTTSHYARNNLVLRNAIQQYSFLSHKTNLVSFGLSLAHLCFCLEYSLSRHDYLQTSFKKTNTFSKDARDLTYMCKFTVKYQKNLNWNLESKQRLLGNHSLHIFLTKNSPEWMLKT